MANTENENPIQGVWLNSFGSIMRLDVQEGRINGCYASTTGSSGAYRVVGFADADPGPDSANRVLAFAVPWRSYLGGQGDTSWHWTSTMSGMYYIDSTHNQRKLEVVNALNATTVFKDSNETVGVYPESLTFEPYVDPSWSCPKTQSTATMGQSADNNRLTGEWYGDGIKLVLKPGEATGYVAGEYTGADGTFPVVGCYDSNPTEPAPTPDGILAVSFVASNVSLAGVNRHSQVALVGHVADCSRKLHLDTFRTFPLVNYTSNRLGHLTLEPVAK